MVLGACSMSLSVGRRPFARRSANCIKGSGRVGNQATLEMSVEYPPLLGDLKDLLAKLLQKDPSQDCVNVAGTRSFRR